MADLREVCDLGDKHGKPAGKRFSYVWWMYFHLCAKCLKEWDQQHPGEYYQSRMIAYKVVRRDGDKLRSLFHPTFEYKVGEWVEAPAGGLLTLFPLFRAEEYMTVEQCEGMTLFTAEVEQEVDLPRLRMEIEDLREYPELVAAIWARKFEELPMSTEDLTGWWPRGTVAYRKVKLIEEVKA